MTESDCCLICYSPGMKTLDGRAPVGGVLPLLYMLLLSHKVFQTLPGILRHGTLKTNGGRGVGGEE